MKADAIFDALGVSETDLRAIARRRGLALRRVPGSDGQRFYLVDVGFEFADLCPDAHLTAHQVAEALVDHLNWG